MNQPKEAVAPTRPTSAEIFQAAYGCLPSSSGDFNRIQTSIMTGLQNDRHQQGDCRLHHELGPSSDSEAAR
jgi:hypothetical protein